MKILQLCNKFIYPPRDGGSIASFYTMKGLALAGCEVTVLAMNTSKHPFTAEKLPEEVKKEAEFFSVDVDTRVKILPALYNLLLNRSYHLARFVSERYNNALIELLHRREFDVALLEGLYLSLYVETIRAFSQAKIVMRAHNAEHQIWRHLAEKEKNFFRRMYLKILAGQLCNYETERLNKYDMLLCFTEEDKNFFQSAGCEIPLFVLPPPCSPIPHGAREKETEDESGLFFLGAMDWLPNVEGLNWFVENVWKEIHKKFPAIKFYIAGRNMQKEKPPFSLWKNMNIVPEGEVRDAYAFMASKPVMIVPLFSGSGIRIKIIEGMMLGKTIIATPLAATGIPCQDGQNILFASTAGEFAKKIEQCIHEKKFRTMIGDHAMRFAQTHYGSRELTEKLMALMQTGIT